jgi:hypothetical protein
VWETAIGGKERDDEIASASSEGRISLPRRESDDANLPRRTRPGVAVQPASTVRASIQKP